MTFINSEDTDFINNVKNRVSHSLDNKGLLINLSTDQCKKYLKRKANSKTRLVVLYVDITGSTQMSHDLSPLDMSLIVQVFSQEVSLAITGFGGYVLKYVGDAVIVLFPADRDPSTVLKNSLNCAVCIQNIINKGINPVFEKFSLPNIAIKIGIDYGDVIIVVYGKNIESSHIDLVGFSISIASKITSLASAGDIVVGENAYIMAPKDEKNYLEPFYQEKNSKWNTVMKYNKNLNYKIYKYHHILQI